MNKKSIVLNGVDQREKRAIMTLEYDGEMARGNVRLYNFSSIPRGIISLGLYFNGQVVKAGLTHIGGMVFNFACKINAIPQSFSCAIVNFLDGDPKPILYGTSEGCCDYDELFDEVVSSLTESRNVSEVESILDRNGIDFDDELKEEIEDRINRCALSLDDNCENCQYKKFYMQSVQSLDQKEECEELSEDLQFYKEMRIQIDQLFATNPNDEYLEKLIPNSKWVKVCLSESEDYYVLGLIYQNEKLMYICYGVPGVYQKNAPKELCGYPVWFPLDENNSQGFGYWLSYQDADSGESVKAVVI